MPGPMDFDTTSDTPALGIPAPKQRGTPSGAPRSCRFVVEDASGEVEEPQCTGQRAEGGARQIGSIADLAVEDHLAG